MLIKMTKKEQMGAAQKHTQMLKYDQKFSILRRTGNIPPKDRERRDKIGTGI